MKRIHFFITLQLIYFLFLFSYYNFISVSYSYMGFTHEINYEKLLIGYLFCLFGCLYYYFYITDYFDRLICFLLILFFTFPNSILYAFELSNFTIVFWAFICIIITHSILRVKPLFKIRYEISNGFIYLLIWSLLILLLIPVVYTHGIHFRLNMLFLEDIYDVRRISRVNNTMISVYSYFWLAKVICPLAIIYGKEENKKILMSFSFIVLVYLFMTTGHKSVLFSLLIIFAFYFGRNNIKNKCESLVKYSFYLFVGIISISIFANINEPQSLLIRRLFFIPALLNIHYFDFFDNNQIFYSNSYLSFLLDYPYPKDPPHLIGSYYYNSEEMSANNGYISDGFANFGNIGIFINIVISSILFRRFKVYSVPPKYLGLLFIMLYAIQGSSLSTVLLTHGGFLIYILIPLIFNRSRSNIDNINEQK